MIVVLLILLFIAVAYFGFEILSRLPKLNSKNAYSWETPDKFLVIEIDAITDKPFDVSFLDSWSVGRSFAIGGKIVRADDEDKNGLFDGQDRCVINVNPSPDWFQESSFGVVRTFNNSRSEVYVWPPYQISNSILDEVRRDLKQMVSIGYKSETSKTGDKVLRVYSFELDERL